MKGGNMMEDMMGQNGDMQKDSMNDTEESGEKSMPASETAHSHDHSE
jgi:hypothetical protein